MYKAAIFGAIIITVMYTWKKLGRTILNAVIRCLFCLVCVYICNDVIQYFGGDFFVKINKITVAISTLFGVSGVAALYALQLFFTIH